MRKRLMPAPLAAALSLSALLAMVALGGGSAAADSGTAVKSAGCTPAKNIEAIIDDSGSMDTSDPGKFRTKLLSAFANIGSNNGRIFGGIEFGSTPNNLFGPATIPAVNQEMQNSFLQVAANNDGTNYQEAWAGATGHNGAADARIFLTDGFPNEGGSPDPPQPFVKTYVIALGEDFSTNIAAQTLLNKIASETGGPAPYFVTQAAAVQPIAADIAAQVACSQAPLTFTRTFTRQGQKVTYKFAPIGGSSDILISWDSPTAIFDPVNFQLVGAVGAGKSVASAAGKKKGLKVRVKAQTQAGGTFATAHVKGLKKAKKALKRKAKRQGKKVKRIRIKFKVKAEQFPPGTAPTVVTTQAIR